MHNKIKNVLDKVHLQNFTANIFNDKMLKAVTLVTTQGCTLVTTSDQQCTGGIVQ